MKTIIAILVSVLLLVASGLVISLLLLPLAAVAQGTLCIDITDENYDLELRHHFAARYGCGSDEEVANLDPDIKNRPGFGYWFILLHAEFLGVSEGEFIILNHAANEAGNSGEALLHIKMVAAYLGKIWFAGWLAIVLLLILPQTDGWTDPPKKMRPITAVLISLGLLILSELACSVLLIPFAAVAQDTFCIDITDESYDLELRHYFAAHYGCGSDEEVANLDPENKNRPGFGYWFILLHAEFLGVSEGEFKILNSHANDAGNSGEALLHIKMVAAYLGKFWLAGWLVIVLLAILPRMSLQKILSVSVADNVLATVVGSRI